MKNNYNFILNFLINKFKYFYFILNLKIIFIPISLSDYFLIRKNFHFSEKRNH